MARFALLAATVVALAVAAPASAYMHIAAGPKGDWPPIWSPYMYGAGASADDGVNHDIVVKPSGGRQLGGFPQVVDFYDYADTVVTSSSLCRVYSTHHGACIVGGGPHEAGNPYSYNSFATVSVDTGDGNDKVTISDALNPTIVSTYTGAGDDRLSISGMWQMVDAYSGGSDTLGPGNDVATIGPAPAFAVPMPYGGAIPLVYGRLVYGGTGDDTLNTLNGSVDQPICGDGNDTLVADPADENHYEPAFGPPVGNDCENRTPPALPAP